MTQQSPKTSSETSAYVQQSQQRQLFPDQLEYFQDTDNDFTSYDMFVLDAGLQAAVGTHVPELQLKLLASLKCPSCCVIVNQDVSTSLVSICMATEYEFKVKSNLFYLWYIILNFHRFIFFLIFNTYSYLFRASTMWTSGNISTIWFQSRFCVLRAIRKIYSEHSSIMKTPSKIIS